MNKKAFSLIELIVGITISMMLMVSVGVFINNGMQNIFSQQKVLENTDNFTYFALNLNTSFNLMQLGSFAPITTSSGILFKRSQNFGEGGFTYIGTEFLDGVYCETGSEDTETNSVFVKNFIPFEEQSDNIFSNYENVLKSTIATGYQSFQKEHKVINFSTKNIIIGKGIFGNKFTEGVSGTDIYLNSPTGLAKDGNILYVSDTLNNRVLYYDISGDKIHLLLDESDGLNEPTGLYHDGNNLYISNSGNGEILKYSSKSIGTNPDLNLSFSGVTANNINNFSVDFLAGSTAINSPNNFSEISDFSFSTNINDNTDYLTGNTNKLEYYFADYSNINSDGPRNLGSCTPSGPNYYLNGTGNPEKEQITCVTSNTGTIITSNGNLAINFTSGSTYDININNITPLLSNTGSYYVNLKLFDGITEKYSGYFQYFTQGDDDLTTKNDNILTIHNSPLNYPTGIWGTGNSHYNEFGDGSYSDLDYHSTDILLGTPIKSLDITNIQNDLLSLFLKYYNRYNCYNLDDNAERSFLLKKNLK